jgi:hypothetical protein
MWLGIALQLFTKRLKFAEPSEFGCERNHVPNRKISVDSVVWLRLERSAKRITNKN